MKTEKAINRIRVIDAELEEINRLGYILTQEKEKLQAELEDEKARFRDE